jgi:hypothetical protein
VSEDLYVELDQTRRLKIGLKEAKALSRVCGGGLVKVIDKLNEFDIETLEKVLWAATSGDDPTVTLSLTGKRVEAYFEREKTLRPLFMLAAKAIDESGMFDQPKEATVGNATAATA